MFKLYSCYSFQDLHREWYMEPAKAQHNVLIYITSGTLTYWVNSDTVYLQKGDVLFIPAGSVRGGEANTIEGHQRYATHFSIEDNNYLLPMLDHKQWCKIKIRGMDYFKQRFSLLNHHWLMKGPYQATLCHAVLLEMLSIINHDLDHQEVPTQKLRLVEEIKKYILNHYNESIKLDNISKVIERSPNYITNVFKEVTGISPIEYLHHVRISKSKDLMLSTPMSIREIADNTGFCDQAYFNRVFKKMTGFSPTSFLNDLRINK